MTKAAEQSLTTQQQRVLAGLEEGLTPARIAKALKITTSGVYGHMRNIRRAGVKIPGEQMNEAAAESNGHSGETPVLDGGALNSGNTAEAVDVPAVIRSQIEQARIEINEIEAEAMQMTERAEKLQREKERLLETVKHHETALNAYAVKKG